MVQNWNNYFLPHLEKERWNGFQFFVSFFPFQLFFFANLQVWLLTYLLWNVTFSTFQLRGPQIKKFREKKLTFFTILSPHTKFYNEFPTNEGYNLLRDEHRCKTIRNKVFFKLFFDVEIQFGSKGRFLRFISNFIFFSIPTFHSFSMGFKGRRPFFHFYIS